MQTKLLTILCLVYLIPNIGFSQDNITDSVSRLTSKYLHSIGKKSSAITEKLNKKSLRALKKFEKTEAKLTHQLSKIDSNYKKLTLGITDKYAALTKGIKSKSSKLKSITGDYIPYLDSFKTSLNFLDKVPGFTDKLKLPNLKLDELQSKLQQTEKIKAYIKERKAQLKETLSKYTKLPPSLRKQYEKYSKGAYYYSAQIKEYKELLNDPNKVEQKALYMLNKLPAFQKFMKENSQLASMFKMPGDAGTVQSLAGLQTRASVNSLIQQQIAMGGPNAQAQIQQNLAQAHAEINKLKDQINKYGGGSGDIDMPDFKPNDQKTKSFLKRLEFGSNIQFGKANKYIPNGADIGLSIGYKLNDKSIIGIGGGYKMGIGDIRHISITHNGISMRSFLEYKLKKQIFISGGYEMNYNAPFKNIEVLKTYSAWQRSGLIGLSKKYKVSKKGNGSMQLLFDFLSKQHQPSSQPILYRIGYVIK